MSSYTERFEEGSAVKTALDTVANWYHVPTLALLFGFMVWVRARTWGNFLVDGTVLFRGNDPWYHFRQTMYTVANWPSTMPFDHWTEFPIGVSNGQFGTLFDQLMASAALIVGLGSPSEHLVRLVTLFAPAILGAAIVVPTYYLGKQVGGRVGGTIAALLVALSAGELLSRSLVGFSDHQVAEAFFQAVAVLAILIALRVAQAEKPVYELILDRDWQALRTPVGWAVIAGVALALYMSMWPPGILLLGILGVYVTIQLPIAYLRGESPEHVGIAVGTIFATAAVLSLATIDELSLNMVTMSLAHPGLATAGVLWVSGLAWLARAFDRRTLDAWQYPATVFGSLLLVAGVFAVGLPDLFSYFVRQITRFVGFTANPTAGASTIGEVQPLPLSQWDSLIEWLGIAPLVAAVGVAIAVLHQYLADEIDPTYLFVALWFVFFVAATFTQRRFAYYLTVPTATLAALVITRVFEYLRSISDNDDIETYEALIVVGVVVALVVPMMFPTVAAIDRSTNNGPGGVVGWQSSLEYIEGETPAVGNYGGAGNADQLDFYGTVPRTDDFDYPDGAYGVMSWWDYGHWITQEGERIPVANPFQGNAKEAAAFLMAQDESSASDALAVVSENDSDATTRYVMVDWKMATANPGFGNQRWGKFFAPSNFLEGVDESTYFRQIRGLVQTQQGSSLTGRYFTVQKQAYYETMAVRLYRYHGSAVSTTDVPGTQLPGGKIPVVDWQNTQVELTDGSQPTWHIPELTENGTAQTIRLFDTMAAAERFVANDSTAQIGGIGKIPSDPVPALQQYRLVQVSDQQFNPFYASQPGLAWFAQSQQFQTGVSNQLLPSFAEPYSAWTKVFERVPGATVEGTGPANTTVTASVEMRMPNANQTFTYRQHAETGSDGEFTMTLPYSTTGYENWGPENGYTNVNVRANGSYQFTAPGGINESDYLYQFSTTANVTEAQVIGTDDDPVDVTLERQVIGQLGNGNETDGTENESNGTDTSDAVQPVDPAHSPATADGGSSDSSSVTTESIDVPTARSAIAGY